MVATKDEKAECVRDMTTDGTIIQHRAVCNRSGCGRMFSLVYDKVSGVAREDWQQGCRTSVKCRNRILGPLSDFKADPVH